MAKRRRKAAAEKKKNEVSVEVGQHVRLSVEKRGKRTQPTGHKGVSMRLAYLFICLGLFAPLKACMRCLIASGFLF